METPLCRQEVPVSVDKKKVFSLIQCNPDSPVYEEIQEAYEELLPTALEMARPVILMRFGEMKPEIATKQYPAGTPVLYVIASVGKELCKASTCFFEQGDYVKGMLMDALADACLFSLEAPLKQLLKEECSKRNVGIRAYLEAPVDVDMQAQVVAWEQTQAERLAGIGISSGKMLDPVKSSCRLYILTEDLNMWKTDHDCRRCPRLDCMFRNVLPVTVTIQRPGKEPVDIDCRDGETLLDAMTRNRVFIESPCGGTGTCGKCKVRVLKGEVREHSSAPELLSVREYENGVRFACQTVPLEDCTLRLHVRDGYEAVAAYGGGAGEPKETSGPLQTEDGLGIAVDVGTTTVAIQLFDLRAGTELGSHTAANHQSAYGADVIARITASTQGKGEELRALIRADLTEGIRSLLTKAQRDPSEVKRMVLAANTTMVHLLMGYSCETLGVAPFTPVNLDRIQTDGAQLLGNPAFANCRCWIFPGISTYVGGDIVSGLLYCGFHKRETPALFIDLGTNGEIAVGSKNRILVASTAAGPAFEGGNISHGVGCVPGAICQIALENKAVSRYKTIREAPPCGICGTGVIELTAELLREGLIDETGLLNEVYFENGFPVVQGTEGMITFRQQDVREIQLAKAAVRAGIETLLEEYGISPDELDAVYVAGGFGYRLNMEKAVFLGLLPQSLQDKVKAVGNSSLGGAARCLLEESNLKWAEELCKVSQEVSLSVSRTFQESYIESMLFEKS